MEKSELQATINYLATELESQKERLSTLVRVNELQMAMIGALARYLTKKLKGDDASRLWAEIFGISAKMTKELSK